MEGAIAPIRDALRLDGADVEFQREESGTLYMRLVLADVSCEECVMPQETIEQILLTQVRKADADVTAVRLEDPRRS